MTNVNGIAITFAVVFVALVDNNWLLHPKPIPALAFGISTVLLPFFIMQPAFGLGVASSKMPNPTQARFHSLMNHTVFGFGLYLLGLLVNWLLRVFACAKLGTIKYHLFVRYLRV